MKEKDFKKIIDKYQKGIADTCEKDQLSNFENYFLKNNRQRVFKSELHKNEIQKNMLIQIKRKINHNPTNWYRIVAGIILLFGMGMTYWLTSPTVKALEIVKISTNENQVKTIILRDSSKVTLNENSVLEFPKDFSDTQRYVRLQGEAYFNIKHDSKRPFKVYADSVVTKVLGTEFNINMQDQSVSVALISGSVDVEGLGVSELLKANEKIDLDYKKHTIELKKFNPKKELFWMHQELVFDNVPLESIVKILQDRFGMIITIKDPSLSKLTITGTFKGKGLSAILFSMSKAVDFKFKKISDQTIIIYNHSDQTN